MLGYWFPNSASARVVTSPRGPASQSVSNTTVLGVALGMYLASPPIEQAAAIAPTLASSGADPRIRRRRDGARDGTPSLSTRSVSVILVLLLFLPSVGGE